MKGIFGLKAENIALHTGIIYTVVITSENTGQKGCRALQQKGAEELVDIEYAAATAEISGLRYIDQDCLTMSWNDDVANDAVLFSMLIRAIDSRMLNKLLSINDRYTMAETYLSIPLAGEMSTTSGAWKSK